MPVITSHMPDTWEELEELVAAILAESGMEARRQVSLKLPRGSVDVDVFATERGDGINHTTICECKDWRTNIPKEVVHAFRTVMHETGANRGYIISRVGFQSGAIEAANATNIELVTFSQFQGAYLTKWINKRIWAIEEELKNFNVYYEPLGRPGYGQLKTGDERAAYDLVWDKYLFAGLMLMPFSPYIRKFQTIPFPKLPFDVAEYESKGVQFPDDIKVASGYREFFELLVSYGRNGLKELRAVNPLTRGKPNDQIEDEIDQPMPS
jgi:hypothetical protein